MLLNTAQDTSPPSPRSAACDLTVVVVNYNVRDFLETALDSVQVASSGLDVEVIVVDNDSADGSTEMVRSHFPTVTLIENDDNVGFSTANNQAIRIARGRYILLLNPDTIVQEDTFRTMITFFEEHPDAGAVGCKILNPDGSFAPESRRAFPTPGVAISRILGLSRIFPKSERFGRYNMTFKPIDEVTEVDALSGSCMMLRGAAIRPDLLFDEQFFMYGEDLDLCYRIQQAGWKLYYTPATQIIHYKGESTKKGDLRYVRLFYGAMLRFTEKHFHGQYSSMFRTAIRLGIFVRGGISAIRRLAIRLAPALLDLVTVFSVVAIVTLVRFRGEIPGQIVYTIGPAYAVATVLAIALLGGYGRGRRRGRFVPQGVLVGLLTVSAASFFLKQIAYSRAVVLVSAPVALVMMLLWRLLRHGTRDETPGAIMVGSASEAARVAAQLRAHPSPPFELLGFVADASDAAADLEAPPRLGANRQLRDIVRLAGAESVIFATGSNTRRDIFGWMQELASLPVSYRVLDVRESYVIGKSSIDQLSLGDFVEADVALGVRRSLWSHRVFDILFATAGILFAPIILVLAQLVKGDGIQQAASIVKGLPSVLVGKRAVVGYPEHHAYRPPNSWGLRPGLIAVVQTHADEPVREEADAAYAYYAMHQSASTDWAIARRALLKPPRPGPIRRRPVIRRRPSEAPWSRLGAKNDANASTRPGCHPVLIFERSRLAL